MSKITSEIWISLKQQVFSKIWFKIFVGLMLLLFVWLGYLKFVKGSVPTGEIGNTEVWSEYQNVVELGKGEEIAPLPELQSEQITTTLNMYFFMANEGNLNLFTSVVDSETMDADYGDYQLGEKFAKIDESMQLLSRNQTLESIEVVRTLPILQKNTVRIVIDLHYSDLINPIRANVLVKTNEQYDINTTDGETFDIPYIKTSVWDLIKHIESEVVAHDI